MACVVIFRLKLRGRELWKANGAGSLQQEAYYRSKCGNSRHPTNHRTKTHVLLSLACLEPRFYCTAASAANSPICSRTENSILGLRNVYCWRSQEVTFVR